MTELPKGMFCSVLIHGAVLGLFLLMSERMSVLGSNRHDIDLILAQTPAPLPDRPPGPTDVGDMAHPPAPDEVLPFDPDNALAPPTPKPPRPMPPEPVPPKPLPPEPDVPPEKPAPVIDKRPLPPPEKPAPVIDKKAPPTRPDKAQVSPTGPEILKKQKEKELQRQKAEDARIRQGLRKVTPVRRGRVPPISPPMVAGVTADDYEKRISSQVKNVLVSMNKGRGGGGGVAGAAQAGAADAQGDPFGAALSAALHEFWNQPSRAEVGRGNPTVDVSITLRADGTVTAFQIIRSSGHEAMDGSVERLFREHRKLPAPSTFGSTDAVRTIKVTFELDPTGSA